MAAPPFNPNEAVPGDSDIVAQYPAVERSFRDIIESWILMEHGRSGHHTLKIGDDSARDAITDWEVGSLFINHTRRTLQYVATLTPTVFWDVGFPLGTRMPFQQTTPPPGWTKEVDVAYSDAVMATSVSSVGVSGTTSATSVFGARTISQANLPNVNFAVTGSFAGSATTSNAMKAFGFDLLNPAGSVKVAKYDDSSPLATILVTGSIAGGAASGGSGTALDFNVKRAFFTIGIKA